jgi:hypothetical protein
MILSIKISRVFREFQQVYEFARYLRDRNFPVDLVNNRIYEPGKSCCYAEYRLLLG